MRALPERPGSHFRDKSGWIAIEPYQPSCSECPGASARDRDHGLRLRRGHHRHLPCTTCPSFRTAVIVAAGRSPATGLCPAAIVTLCLDVR